MRIIECKSNKKCCNNDLFVEKGVFEPFCLLGYLIGWSVPQPMKTVATTQFLHIPLNSFFSSKRRN